MTGTGQAELSREQFITVMKTEYPQLAKGQGGNMLQLLFDSFDTVRQPHALVSYRYAAADVMCLCRGVLQDMSGSIDIEEFSIGIGKLTKGSTSDKLELLFEVYDQDRSGSVTIEELISFVSKATGEYEEARQYTEQVIKRLATNNGQGKGEITESDFAAALRRDPGLYVPTLRGVLIHGLVVVEGIYGLHHACRYDSLATEALPHLVRACCRSLGTS